MSSFWSFFFFIPFNTFPLTSLKFTHIESFLTSSLPLLPNTSFPLSHSISTDVLDGVRGHHEDDAVDGERGEDDEEGRAEEEQLHFGAASASADAAAAADDDDDTIAAATSASALVTNPLPLEALLPTTSSTQGPLELTNPGSDLTSLGKITGCGCAALHVLSVFF